MKIIHLADLHIGKSVNGFSMIDDQRYILKHITEIIKNEMPQAVVLAGDIYDRFTPSADAVTLFDGFLTDISALTEAIFVTSGNHDSAGRLAFGGRLMEKSGVYISPVYAGRVEPVVLSDEFGDVGFYCFPFLKPAFVRDFFKDAKADTYEEAFSLAVDSVDVPQDRRNVAIAHQFITGAEKGGSEELSVGGIDEISHRVFDRFDYTALGHIHRPQGAGSPFVRYSGSPLKYSLAEAGQKKSLTVVELGPKGKVEIREFPLMPLHDLREIRGSYDELTLRENYDGTDTEAYLGITLTDKYEIPDAIGKLRCIYPNIMELRYENAFSDSTVSFTSAPVEDLTPAELFARFYREMNGEDMDSDQLSQLECSIEEAGL